MLDTLRISAEVFGAVALTGAFVMGILLRRYEVAIGVVLLLGATLWHADIAGRWEESDLSKEEFDGRVQYMPLTIGDWEGEDLEVKDSVREAAGAVGYVSRVYTNKETGKQVTLWLIVGHARDICRHTPNVCYIAQGFEALHEPRREEISFGDAGPAEFWMNDFAVQVGGGKVTDRIFWSWAIDPNWVAPKLPRMKFRNTKALYKMYFTSRVQRNRDKTEVSPAKEFAPIFIPIVNKALFSDHPTTVETVETKEESPAENADAASGKPAA